MSNQHDRFVAALKLKGCAIDPARTARSRRYTVMSHPDMQDVYFIGKAGAVRRGRTAVGSLPISDAAKARLLAIGGAL